jgi:hypothetical protein
MLSSDRFQLLAASAQICVAVLANEDVTDVELIPVRPRTISDDEMSRRCAGRNLHFLGALGTVDGIAHAQFDEPLDAQRVSALARAFAVYVQRVKVEAEPPQSAGDFVEWATRLHSLPDTRN